MPECGSCGKRCGWSRWAYPPEWLSAHVTGGSKKCQDRRDSTCMEESDHAGSIPFEDSVFGSRICKRDSETFSVVCLLLLSTGRQPFLMASGQARSSFGGCTACDVIALSTPPSFGSCLYYGRTKSKQRGAGHHPAPFKELTGPCLAITRGESLRCVVFHMRPYILNWASSLITTGRWRLPPLPDREYGLQANLFVLRVYRHAHCGVPYGVVCIFLPNYDD